MESYLGIKNYKMEFLDKIALLIRPHATTIALAIIATTFAVFGNTLNIALKAATKKMNFFIRFVFYILIYAFGIGILSASMSNFLQKLIRTLPSLHLIIFVVTIFLILCFVAKKEKQI